MKIAQISPLYESVPPKLYGGTERVVSYLTEALVELGHDVTLYASGDSVTKARLISPKQRALRLDKQCVDGHAFHVLMMEMLCRDAEKYDVLHYHIDYLHFPLSRRCGVPQLTTLHGRLDLPHLVPLYEEYDDMPVVSISNQQRRPLSMAHWIGTVYHGLPEQLYPFNETPGDYFAFLGRISPEKRCDRAIRIAKAVGLPLRIAAKVDRADEGYFADHIQPLLHDPLVDFVGEIGDGEKGAFLGNARALLFPIDWPEPFGLVMIEAMACGTPVIAYGRGSVPEIITNGVTGFVVNSFEEAVDAAGCVDELDRWQCREEFMKRFSASRMAADYLKVYERLINANRSTRSENSVQRTGVA